MTGDADEADEPFVTGLERSFERERPMDPADAGPLKGPKYTVLTTLVDGYNPQRATELPDYQLAIDLEERKVHDDHGLSATFEIDDFTRHCLLEGLDDIGLTLKHEADITAYEARHPVSQKIV